MAGGREDLDHPPGTGQRQGADQRSPDQPDGQGQDDHGRRPDPVDPDDPAVDPVPVPFALPGRDPPDDGHQQGRTGHGQDQEHPEQDDEGPVAPTAQEPGHENGGEQTRQTGGGPGAHDGQDPTQLRATPAAGAAIGLRVDHLTVMLGHGT